MSDETLKTCPFCGGEARVGSMEVYCSDCSMGCFSYASVERAELVDRWNRRADDGQAGGGG